MLSSRPTFQSRASSRSPSPRRRRRSSRLRLRRELQARLAVENLSPTARARVGRALRDLDRATLSTIHAFAAAIIREQPVQSRIDPRFRVLDELESGRFFREFWDRWVGARLEDDSDVARLRPALLAGVRLEPDLYELARELELHRDVVHQLVVPPAIPDLELRMRQLGDDILSCVRHAEEECRDPTDAGLLRLRQLGTALATLETSRSQRLAGRLPREGVAGHDRRAQSGLDAGSGLAQQGVAARAQATSRGAATGHRRRAAARRARMAGTVPRRLRAGEATPERPGFSRPAPRSAPARARRSRGATRSRRPHRHALRRRVPGHRPVAGRARALPCGERRTGGGMAAGPSRAPAVPGRRPEAVHLPLPAGGPGRLRGVRANRRRVGRREADGAAELPQPPPAPAVDERRLRAPVRAGGGRACRAATRRPRAGTPQRPGARGVDPASCPRRGTLPPPAMHGGGRRPRRWSVG